MNFTTTRIYEVECTARNCCGRDVECEHLVHGAVLFGCVAYTCGMLGGDGLGHDRDGMPLRHKLCRKAQREAGGVPAVRSER